jgi:hypothetical protein
MKKNTKTTKPEAVKEVVEPVKVKEAAIEPDKPAPQQASIDELENCVFAFTNLGGQIPEPYPPQLKCNVILHRFVMAAAGFVPWDNVIVRSPRPGQIIIEKFDATKLPLLEHDRFQKLMSMSDTERYERLMKK